MYLIWYLLTTLLWLMLIIDLRFLIPPVIAEIFNPTAKLAILTKTPSNEANAEIKTGRR